MECSLVRLAAYIPLKEGYMQLILPAANTSSGGIGNCVSYSTYHSLHIQYLQETPEDGPLRSETCRADI